MQKLRKLKIKERPTQVTKNYWCSLEVNIDERTLNIYSTSNHKSVPVLEFVIKLNDYVMFATLFIKNNDILEFINGSENFKNCSLYDIELQIISTVNASGIILNYYKPEEIAFKILTPQNYIILVPLDEVDIISPFINMETTRSLTHEIIGSFTPNSATLFNFNSELLNITGLETLLSNVSNIKKYDIDLNKFEKLYNTQLFGNVDTNYYQYPQYHIDIYDDTKKFLLARYNKDTSITPVLSFMIEKFLAGDILLSTVEKTNIYYAFNKSFKNNTSKLSIHSLLADLFKSHGVIRDSVEDNILSNAKELLSNSDTTISNYCLPKAASEKESAIDNTGISKLPLNTILAYKVVNSDINIYKITTSAKVHNTYIEIQNVLQNNVHLKVAETLFSNSPKVELLAKVTSSTSNESITDILMVEIDNVINDSLSNLQHLQKYVNVLIAMQRFHSANKLLRIDTSNTSLIDVKELNTHFDVLLIN